MILEQFEEAMTKSNVNRPWGGEVRVPCPGLIRIIRLWVCSQSRRLMTQRVGGFIRGYDRSARFLPALTRNTRLVNYSKRRWPHIYTNGELDFSQGWPSLNQYTGGYEECIPYDVSKLSAPTRRGLRGNSVHIAAIATFLTFCLGIHNNMKQSKHDRHEQRCEHINKTNKQTICINNTM